MPVNPSPAVLRAGQLLWHMARRPSEAYSVSELARMAGIPRATCDSVLQALAEQGLVVRREPELRYQLGEFCVALGDAAREANPILSAASVEAEELARKLNACVAVSAPVADETRVMAVFDWGPPLGIRPRRGQSMPLVPPFGAVFVAWDDAEARTWLGRAGENLEDHQRDQWRRALAGIRRRGYVISLVNDRAENPVPDFEILLTTPDAEYALRQRDELVGLMQHTEYFAEEIDDDAAVRLSQISAPVFDSTGRAAASLMLMGPQHGLTGREVNALGRQVADAARRAGKSAGNGA
ncbi:helix-turn-helix domain-containing protein [Actinomadura sp. LD22]|uniref:Helix-turn-helix domain-containing protein n=1 Tax=Actinomadura physcomitrii TaxID=2650748 RepID=A0A6I4MAZ6_9ACTN|nr:helix-turn-helix domain-containing protein [Actinomadura physcomitrii]MVZ99818.1 helix-turn-helix domain-containing protein [Actinomadura physcomitrii]